MKYTIINAFTTSQGGGNPAAVILLDQFIEDSKLQAIAKEINLSETAFLVKDKTHTYQLRWFTPQCEVSLCGHATLASAYFLWQNGYCNPIQSIKFKTKSGDLEVSKQENWLTMNFPIDEIRDIDVIPKALSEAIGKKILSVKKGNFDYLVLLENEKILKDLMPDFEKLRRLDCRGIIVTAICNESKEYDFVSRFFAPQAGILEDPVTGSAHTSLAPFWAKKLGKNTFFAYQASKRKGDLKVALEENRVLISGQACSAGSGVAAC